jgi:tetratricopeptide (TPR) repeat protein
MKTSLKFFLGMIVTTSLFLGGNTFAQNQNSVEEVKRLIIRGKTAYSMGNYEDALSEYKKAQSFVPDFPDLYKVIADVYEKKGSNDDLKSALVHYSEYLRLSPNATDRDAVLEKIASLEYRYEKQAEQTKIMDDLSGIWVSNLVLKSDERKPYVILEIKEIQKTGKYRVTVLPESGFYKASLIEKTVNIIPTKDNSFRFILADAQAYTPSGSTYDFLRLGVSALGGGDLVQGLAQTTINAVQASDLPSNTQTAYDFKLKYTDGKLDGLLNVLQKQAKANENNTTQDEIYGIIFRKDNRYFEKINAELAYNAFSGVTRNKSGKSLNVPEIEKILQNYPDLLQQWKHTSTNAGTGMMSGGIVILISGLVYPLLNDNLKLAGKIMIGVGSGLTVIGIPLMYSGMHQQKKIMNEYNLRRKNEQNVSLNLGITPSGNFGFVLNF